MISTSQYAILQSKWERSSRYRWFLIHWLAVITVSKIFWEILQILFQYLLFLVKEQILLAFVSSLIRNLSFEICQLIMLIFKELEYQETVFYICSDDFLVCISYIVFHNKKPLCCTFLIFMPTKTTCVEHSVWNLILWDDPEDCYCCNKQWHVTHSAVDQVADWWSCAFNWILCVCHVFSAALSTYNIMIAKIIFFFACCILVPYRTILKGMHLNNIHAVGAHYSSCYIV